MGRIDRSPTRPRAHLRCRRWRTCIQHSPERGAVAGLEGVMFSVLILMGGLVVIVNAWSVIDSRAMLDSAAREYVRTYTRSNDSLSARVAAEHAARRTIITRGRSAERVEFIISTPNGFGPCALMTVSISVQVPTLRAPFLGSFGSSTATSRLSGLVEAHRQITPDAAYDPSRTECFSG